MEEVAGAITTEGACEVVDIEVEVVSTTTALLDVAGIDTGAAAGTVDRTAWGVELDITGAATGSDQYIAAKKKPCDFYLCRYWLPL